MDSVSLLHVHSRRAGVSAHGAQESMQPNEPKTDPSAKPSAPEQPREPREDDNDNPNEGGEDEGSSKENPNRLGDAEQR